MSASSSSARQLLILLLFLLAFLLKKSFFPDLFQVSELALPYSKESVNFIAFAFGYYRLERLGSTLDLFEKNQGWRSFNQIFYANSNKLLSLERVVPRILSKNFALATRYAPFYWFLKAQNLLFPHISYPSRIGSASDDEPMRKLFLFFSLGRLLDWVESLPRHKGSDLSESPNGGRENILIESPTVLNSEKDFSKFDQIDRESHHLLGGLTNRPSWAERPCRRTFL